MTAENQLAQPVPASSALEEAYRLVRGDREGTYGDAVEDYTRVTDLFKLMTGHVLTPADGALFMECVKLARVAHNHQRGDYHHDSVVDACGYFQVYSDIVQS